MLKTTYDERPSLKQVLDILRSLESPVTEVFFNKHQKIAIRHEPISKRNNFVNLNIPKSSEKITKTYFICGMVSSDDSNRQTKSLLSSQPSLEEMKTLSWSDNSEEKATVSDEAYSKTESEIENHESNLGSLKSTISNCEDLKFEEIDLTQTINEIEDICGICKNNIKKSKILLSCRHEYDVSCLSGFIIDKIRACGNLNEICCPNCMKIIQPKYLSESSLYLDSFTTNKIYELLANY